MAAAEGDTLFKENQARHETKQLLKPYANWRELLKPPPVLITTQEDFESIFNEKGYYLIEYPHLKDFRKCVQKMSNDEKNAFQEGYTKMRAIFKSIFHMDEKVQNFIKEDKEVNSLSLTDLEEIKSKTKNFMDSAQGTKQIFLELIYQVHMLLEDCKMAKCDYEKTVEDVHRALQREMEKKEKIEQDKQIAEQDLETVSSQIKKYFSSPCSGHLILMACSKAGSDGDLPNKVVDTIKMILSCSSKNMATNKLLNIAYALHFSVMRLKKMAQGQIQEDEICKLRNSFQSLKATGQELGSFKDKVQKAWQLGFEICNKFKIMAFAQNKEMMKQEVMMKISTLDKEVSEFDTVGREFLQSLPCPFTEPNLPTDQGNSDFSEINKMIREEKNKAKEMVKNLKSASEAFRQTLDEKKEQELITILWNLACYEQKQDDYKEILKILSEVLDNLEKQKLQWERMVEFFEVLEFCLSQVKISLDSVEVTQQITKSNPNFPVYIQAFSLFHEVYLLSSAYLDYFTSFP